MMGDSNNDVLEKIDSALLDAETPRWAIPILLCIRDDHVTLRDHIACHHRRGVSLAQILTSVLTAIAIAISFWLLSGRWPLIFGSP